MKQPDVNKDQTKKVRPSKERLKPVRGGLKIRSAVRAGEVDRGSKPIEPV
jgi:hypothetical protein